MKRKENELGRKLELSEFWDETERAKGTALDLSLSQLRVVVLENPFARIQLPRKLFRGPYDERYAGSEGRIVRVFCGDQLAELEEEAREAELAGGPVNPPTKEELEQMHFSKLDKLCRRIAGNPHASSVEADQARSLITEMLTLSFTFRDMKNSPALGGKTVNDAQMESLKASRRRFPGGDIRFVARVKVMIGRGAKEFLADGLLLVRFCKLPGG